MRFKIDTKEKFHVITLNEEELSDNLAAEFSETVLQFLKEEIKNVVVKMKAIRKIDEKAAEELTRLQQTFYENNASFVICELEPAAEQRLDELELLEVMNVTPSESEAWDIVQMEEIERELMEGNDDGY